MAMIHHFSLLNPTARKKLISEIATEVLPQSPFFTPVMKNGASFRYTMTNCGILGWVSDTQGYRYTKYHPYLGTPWAKLTPSIREIINFLKSQKDIPAEFNPEACLINKYILGESLGLHQDNTEKDLTAPIISISLGAPGIFLLGGTKRNEPMTEYLLKPGDIFIMSGRDRNRYHAFKGITLGQKRVNLTIRQVNPR
jgi:alkylated DNA repair protein (DNA oxidative demethylase)